MSFAPFRVKAIYEYKSAEPDDLVFPNGQIITVTGEEDEDWYAGEYVDDSGSKHEGIFPRNFVEKYEPAIPSRPARAKPKDEISKAVQPPAIVADTRNISTTAPDSLPESTSTQQVPVTEELPQAPPVAQTQASVQRSTSSAGTKAPASTPVPAPTTTTAPKAQNAKPPVAEKPASGSFRDRIAAFNTQNTAPITPFKPGGQGGATSFIKKPFVAPPPSKNAYVPPPREAPVQKIYRREEDPDAAAETAHTEDPATEPAVPQQQAEDNDQPKPTSLKERIALLQKQQLEQAARNAESAQKKEKPKKPPKKKVESEEQAAQAPNDASVAEQAEPNEVSSRKSVDFADDEAGPLRGASNRQASAMRTPPAPSRELVSDTNDADDSGAGDTEDAQETSTEEERQRPLHDGLPHQIATTMNRDPGLGISKTKPNDEEGAKAGDEGEDQDEGEEEGEEEEEEEEEEDPEVRRRREIRDRMAKMSGGMGMMGMFGPTGGIPAPAASRKPRVSAEAERQPESRRDHEEALARAPPVPLMALPGMSRQAAAEVKEEPEAEEDENDAVQPHTEVPSPRALPIEGSLSAPPSRKSTDRPPPPPPQDRAVPPPPPREARAAPPPPPAHRVSSLNTLPDSAAPQSPLTRASRPEQVAEQSPNNYVAEPEKLAEDQVPSEKTTSAPAVPRTRPGTDSLSQVPVSPTAPPTFEKRMSRGPPPIPGAVTAMISPQTRAPPPPPPGQTPSRTSTSDSYTNMASERQRLDNEAEEENMEYDGDYDTDIASGVKHKDALKAHGRDSSLDEELLTDDAAVSSHTTIPARAPPPLPNSSAPRAVPPPPPLQQPGSISRRSTDVPRAAPPPIPSAMDTQAMHEDYDPYRYPPQQQGAPPPPAKQPFSPALRSPTEEFEQDDMYETTPTTTRGLPPPPDRNLQAATSTPVAVSSSSNPPRPSTDLNRSNTQSRRSMEQSRPSGEHGIIAADVDLAPSTMWWSQENMLPPSLQNRNDILYEVESNSTTKRGGHTTITKDIYVLYMDYSQTTINVNFDPSDPPHATLEQRHDRPPPPLRADQLESASAQYGAKIADAASSTANSSIGDGSAQALIMELLKPMSSEVLLPVGTRAYGALVYANLANASTQQYDQIRPGDIVTFRNAKFAGHKGGLHQKYTLEAGRPDHVAVVSEWDGTKKKIRAWEQGREGGKKGKVMDESFRVGDLKSGEVKVWRVVPRSWVGWN